MGKIEGRGWSILAGTCLLALASTWLLLPARVASGQPETEPAAQAAPTTQPATTEAAAMPSQSVATEQPQPTAPVPASGPLQVDFSGSYLYGPANGFVQITADGKRGSTNASRPTFKELGIDTVQMPDGQLTFSLGPNQIFAGAQLVRLSDSHTLSKRLVSDGITYPAGTHVDADLQLDWYRLGYGYEFTIFRAENSRPELTVTPFADALFYDFNYHLSSLGSPSASRSFTRPGMQIGGNIDWRIGGGPFVLELGGASFPIHDDWARISTEHVTGSLDLGELGPLALAVHVGAAWEQQDFRFHQRASSHVKADFGPMLIAGLQVRF